MIEADDARELLIRLISLHVEVAATRGHVLAVEAEAERLLDQNPNTGMSLQDIRDEITRCASQWQAVGEFRELPVAQ